MRKTVLIGVIALVAMLPASATGPNVAVASITNDYSTDHNFIDGGDDLANCGGTAPADTTCDTGTHLRAGAGTFGPGSGEGCPTACNTALPGYTGTLKMNIIYKIWSSGTSVSQDQVRTNTCNFSNGAVLSCLVTGVAPPGYPGAVQGQLKEFGGYITMYDHDCTSFNLGTTTPGGSGPWMCFAWHGLLHPQP